MVAIVMTSSAHVRGRARRFGRYTRVAVVDVDYAHLNAHGAPKMISTRAIGVDRILRDYGACSEGKTERCEYARALKAARELAREFNNARDVASAEDIIGAGGSA